MKYTSLIAVLLLNIVALQAQPPQSPINFLRAYDNFNFVKKDTSKKGLNVLKHIPISKQANISFGGDLREQYQYFENQNFGDVPPTFKEVSVGQLWHRIMVHSNLEIGAKTRIFVQLNSTFRFFNPNPLTPEIDENSLNLYQAFIEYKPNKNWTIKLGREEMAYGNNRIITFREGPNTRLSFDAAIVKYQTNKRRIDFLALTPVISTPGTFDDKSFKDFVYGIYGTENFIPKKLLVDYYILNFESDSRRYNYAAGKENRQSYGLRIFSQNPMFNYELETTLQSGTFNNQSINAAAVSSDISYKINKKYQVVLGIGANYVSGDKDRNDNKLNTYNLIYSKPSYGLAAPIGSSNIVNLNPYVKLNPTKKLSLYAGVYFMSRQSNQDGTYSPGMAQVRPAPAILFLSSKKSIGTQYAIETGYQLNQNISFAIDAAYFAAGNYVKETGKGLNSSYLSFKGSFKF